MTCASSLCFDVRMHESCSCAMMRYPFACHMTVCSATTVMRPVFAGCVRLLALLHAAWLYGDSDGSEWLMTASAGVSKTRGAVCWLWWLTVVMPVLAWWLIETRGLCGDWCRPVAVLAGWLTETWGLCGDWCRPVAVLAGWLTEMRGAVWRLWCRPVVMLAGWLTGMRGAVWWLMSASGDVSGVADWDAGGCVVTDVGQWWC